MHKVISLNSLSEDINKSNDHLAWSIICSFTEELKHFICSIGCNLQHPCRLYVFDSMASNTIVSELLVHSSPWLPLLSVVSCIKVYTWSFPLPGLLNFAFLGNYNFPIWFKVVEPHFTSFLDIVYSWSRRPQLTAASHCPAPILCLSANFLVSAAIRGIDLAWPDPSRGLWLVESSEHWHSVYWTYSGDVHGSVSNLLLCWLVWTVYIHLLKCPGDFLSLGVSLFLPS